MMSAPLRQADFATILDDFRPSLSAVPHARTSAAPIPKVVVSKARGRVSISKPSASSEKSDLVGLLLRTALISELGELTPLSLRWRHSATPAGRSWFVLATSAPITSDPGHGSSAAILHKLPTPMASDGMKDGAGGGSGSTYPLRQILATPRKTDADRGFRGDVLSQLNGYLSKHAGMLHTPTMDAVLDGAQTGRAPDKWAYARQIAALLTEAGLTGPSRTLPTTYGWMMGFPPGWLARAFQSAMARGSLLPASPSRRSATPSSRKSLKPLDERSAASS